LIFITKPKGRGYIAVCDVCGCICVLCACACVFERDRDCDE
jgi:hypothetical protein